MARLNDKVAIITGASRGMGTSHAKRFVAEGAFVLRSEIERESIGGHGHGH